MMKEYWRTEAWTDLISLVAAVFLFLSPWIFGFTSAAEASRNAQSCGTIIALASIAAIFAYAEWENWLSLVLGLWLIISPWILAFHGMLLSATRVELAVGMLVVIFAAGRLLANYGSRLKLSPRMKA